MQKREPYSSSAPTELNGTFFASVLKQINVMMRMRNYVLG